MSCDYASILAASRCYECLPPSAQMGAQTYLLKQIAGFGGDVGALMNAAKCIANCIPPGILNEVKTRLLCEVVDNLAPPAPPEPPAPECDADAQAFITAAGLDPDSVEAAAICVLVSDLKAYPASQPAANRYWARDILIYPFVGGNAASHAVNLKTPGTYNLQFLGATPPIHSNLGVQGRAATCWANTQYVIPAGSQNNLRVSYYLNQDYSTVLRAIYGTRSNAGLHQCINYAATQTARFLFNDNTQSSSVITLKPRGMYFQQRREAANKQWAYLNSAWTDVAVASTGVSNNSIFLFARNTAGTADLNCDVRLSSFSLGSVLDPVGVSQVEKDEYKSIWDRYQNLLGRAYP